MVKGPTTLEAVRSGGAQKRELDAVSNPPIIVSMRVCEEAVLPAQREANSISIASWPRSDTTDLGSLRTDDAR